MAENKPSPQSMRDWGEKLRAGGKLSPDMQALVADFSAQRKEGWKLLEELDLPRDTVREFTLLEFLTRIEEIAPANVTHNWFVLIEKRSQGAGRYRKADLKSGDIRGFVESTIAKNQLNPVEFDVWIADNYPQIYGGNIVVGTDGNLLAEFIHGNQGVMAEGRYNASEHGPRYTVTRDPYTNSFRYSWNDTDAPDGAPLRELLHRTIMSIPHEGENRDMKFRPGYYEFMLTDKTGSGQLQPSFIDCRQSAPMTTLPGAQS